LVKLTKSAKVGQKSYKILEEKRLSTYKVGANPLHALVVVPLVVVPVVVAAIDPAAVRADEGALKPPVQVHPIGVKEQRKLRKEQVNVGGQGHGDEQQRRRAHQLVRPLVADDGEGGGVVKHVVVAVDGCSSCLAAFEEFLHERQEPEDRIVALVKGGKGKGSQGKNAEIQQRSRKNSLGVLRHCMWTFSLK
jgi:hypothetical protein